MKPVGEMVHSEVESQVWGSLRPGWDAAVRDEVADAVWSPVSDRVRLPVWDRVWPTVFVGLS